VVEIEGVDVRRPSTIAAGLDCEATALYIDRVQAVEGHCCAAPASAAAAVAIDRQRHKGCVQYVICVRCRHCFTEISWCNQQVTHCLLRSRQLGLRLLLLL
jgi:hypothetical protein